MAPDALLIDAVARGRDRNALSRLYDRHAPAVFGLACRMLGDRAEAEDLLQEVFLAVWERAGSFDPARGLPGAWIGVIARSRCLDRLRRRKVRQDREKPLFFEEGSEEAVPLSAIEPGRALEDLAGEENRRRVRAALASLPDGQKAALEAAYFEGLTQPEIAAKLNQPLGTVKTWTRRGLLKLAEALRETERS